LLCDKKCDELNSPGKKVFHSSKNYSNKILDVQGKGTWVERREVTAKLQLGMGGRFSGRRWD